MRPPCRLLRLDESHLHYPLCRLSHFLSRLVHSNLLYLRLRHRPGSVLLSSLLSRPGAQRRFLPRESHTWLASGQVRPL